MIDRGEPNSGCSRQLPFYILKDGRGQLHQACTRPVFGFDMNGNAARGWKRFRNHLKLFPIEPDTIAGSVTELLYPGANLFSRTGMKTHNGLILRLHSRPGKGE